MQVIGNMNNRSIIERLLSFNNYKHLYFSHSLNVEDVDVDIDQSDEENDTKREGGLKYTRTMEDELEYDPYETIQFNGDTYTHDQNNKSSIIEDDYLEPSAELYESIGNSSQVMTKKIIDNVDPKLDKNPADLYAKVRKISSVSNNFGVGNVPVKKKGTVADDPNHISLCKVGSHCGKIEILSDNEEDEGAMESILKRNCGKYGWQAADI